VTAAAAVSQRKRWEGGRIELLRAMLPRVWRAALAQRSRVLVDIALELLIPPLSYPALLLGVGVALEGASVALHAAPTVAAPVWLFAGLGLIVHVARGWQLSGTGLNGALALLGAPVYVAWKLVVARPFGRAQSWVRTRRVAEDARRDSSDR
jgi:hypothetical protein